jgi:hypothetical protein
MKSWIFQGNPDVFDVDGYLRDRKDITWLVRQKHFKGEIRPGDDVYIWRADGFRKGSGGIVAKGVILSPPRIFEDNVPDLWKQVKGGKLALRTRIELEEVRLDEMEGMLLRVNLEKVEGLKNLLILRMRALTNYRLEPEQAERIGLLWEEHR